MKSVVVFAILFSQVSFATSRSAEEKAAIAQKAEKGDGEALFLMGYEGIGKEKPIYYYEKASEAGYNKAFEYAMDDFLFRAGAEADIVKAKKIADLIRKKYSPKEIGPNTTEKIKAIDRCFEAGQIEIPQSDQPTAEEKKYFLESKTDCDLLHAEIAPAKGWSAYHKCLLSQKEPDNNALSEIYANGWGVQRNAKLAMALACHGGSVPAELQGMVDTLYVSKDKPALEKDFLFCDHVTSGLNGGFCAARSEKIAEMKRDGEASNLIRNWSEEQKRSYRTLRKIADQFFQIRARSEQDLSGTARGQFVVEEEAKLRDEFLSSIKLFESDDKIPKETNFAAADKELNDVYSQLMKKEVIQQYSTIRKSDIKDTQKKWILYRDAWVKFAAVKYPKTIPEVWKTWITTQRVSQLKELLTLK